jgi:hypothetical protein
VVVGSGAAGSAAAIAAARTGADVLLLEKLPFLGGNSTAVLDTFYGFYTPGQRAQKVVGGIGDDVVAELRRLGPVVERANTYGAGTGITYLADHLKVVWEHLVVQSGARVLLHAFVQDATAVDGRVTTLTVATKAGLIQIAADVVIDASGDADVCHHAGFGYEAAGAVTPAQTLTTTFRMVNVDHDRRDQMSKAQFHEAMEQAAESGDYDLPRREGSDHITPVNGMVATVMTRIDQLRPVAATPIHTQQSPQGTANGPAHPTHTQQFPQATANAPAHPTHTQQFPQATANGPAQPVRNATDPEVLTSAEMEGRRQALEYVRFLVDRIPGYERASLAALSTQIGLRETRRVWGDYRLTREDVVAARQFDDQIGLCGAPIEDHHGGAGTGTTWEYLPEGAAVGIPLRTLVPRDGRNVLVAGRCFSAEHDAQASVRSMAQCMAMGHAAGTVAALAARADGEVRSVSPADARTWLRKQGAVLSIEESG